MMGLVVAGSATGRTAARAAATATDGRYLTGGAGREAGEAGKHSLSFAFARGTIGRLRRHAKRAHQLEFLRAVVADIFINGHIDSLSIIISVLR